MRIPTFESVSPGSCAAMCSIRWAPVKCTLDSEASVDVTERKRAAEVLGAREEAFRLAFENANIGMCLVDTGGRLVRVNREMSAIFGYAREELEGMSVNDITHPDFRDVSPTFIRRAEAGEIDRTEFEKAYIHKDGRIVWGRVSSSLVRDARGEPLQFISHVLDITDRKRTEELLRASEARYRFLAENMVDVVWTLDPNTGRFTYVSPSVEQLRGYTPEEVMAEPAKAALTQESVEAVFHGRATVAESLLDEGNPPLVRTQRIDQPRRDGSIVPTEVVTRLITGDGGRIVEVLGVTRDITERLKAEEEIRKLNAELEHRVAVRTAELEAAVRELEKMHDIAYFDQLTGIGNRRYVEARIASYLAERRRHGGGFALLFVDVDRFKEVNDTFGHDVGDAVLRTVGSTLRDAARESDFAGRWGGDEFIIALTHIQPTEIRKAAERLRVLVSRSETTTPRERLSVTVSIGAAISRPEDSLSTLVNRADRLMYEAKIAGRNCVVAET